MNKSKMTDISHLRLDILAPFTREYSKKMYASEIARIAEKPQKTVSRQLNKYCEMNLIRYNREGKNKYYYLDLENPATKILLNAIETYKSIKFLVQNKRSASLIRELCKNSIVLLFGSYAKGTAKMDSDIDLVIIGKKQQIERILERYPLKISPKYTTIEKLRKLIKERNALAIEIKKDHILFNEIEKFIEMFIEAEK